MSDKDDLTRLEDISEFLHESDPELDELFKKRQANIDARNQKQNNSSSISDDKTQPNIELPSNFSVNDNDDSDDDLNSNDDFSSQVNDAFENTVSFDDNDTSEDSSEVFTDSNSDEDETEKEDFSLEENDFSSDSFEESNDDFGQDSGFQTDFAQDDKPFGENNDEGFDTGDQQFGESFIGMNHEDDEEALPLVSNEVPDSFDSENSTFEDEGSTEETELSSPLTNEENDIAEGNSFNDDNLDTDEQVKSERPVIPVTEEIQELNDVDKIKNSTLFESNSNESRTEPEKFNDVKDFGKSISYGSVSIGGNPPYSLMLKDIIYEEDSEDIIIILRNHGLLTSENENDIKQSLSTGGLLISQINEFSAIYLAHKLRRFDLDLFVGLSDELHPSKSYSNDFKGLISKDNIFQNRSDSIDLEKVPVNIQSIVTTTLPGLDGHKIHKYLGVIAEHTIISEDILENKKDIPPPKLDNLELNISEGIDDKLSKYETTINEVYDQLLEKMKKKALKLKANAIIGINFQLTPVATTSSYQVSTNYKVTCTGNSAWISGVE